MDTTRIGRVRHLSMRRFRTFSQTKFQVGQHVGCNHEGGTTAICLVTYFITGIS